MKRPGSENLQLVVNCERIKEISSAIESRNYIIWTNVLSDWFQMYNLCQKIRFFRIFPNKVCRIVWFSHKCTICCHWSENTVFRCKTLLQEAFFFFFKINVVEILLFNIQENTVCLFSNLFCRIVVLIMKLFSLSFWRLADEKSTTRRKHTGFWRARCCYYYFLLGNSSSISISLLRFWLLSVPTFFIYEKTNKQTRKGRSCRFYRTIKSCWSL